MKGANTRPEILLRSELWRMGLRYRKNYKAVEGKADLVFPKGRVAVFVDGCFWHGCPEHYVRPKSHVDFWASKIVENVLRDRRQTLALENRGWRVLRVWEHEVLSTLPQVIHRICSTLSSTEDQSEPTWRILEVVPLIDDIERRILVDLRDETLKHSVVRKRCTRKV
jgi:DNA mismatch endonuclease (patch repair protein)